MGGVGKGSEVWLPKVSHVSQAATLIGRGAAATSFIIREHQGPPKESAAPISTGSPSGCWCQPIRAGFLCDVTGHVTTPLAPAWTIPPISSAALIDQRRWILSMIAPLPIATHGINPRMLPSRDSTCYGRGKWRSNNSFNILFLVTIVAVVAVVAESLRLALEMIHPTAKTSRKKQINRAGFTVSIDFNRYLFICVVAAVVVVIIIVVVAAAALTSCGAVSEQFPSSYPGAEQRLWHVSGLIRSSLPRTPIQPIRKRVS